MLVAVGILVSTFGCANGLVLAGARVSYAMAKDGLFLRPAARLNHQGVPGVALWMQAAWACVLCLSGTYSELLDYVVFAVLLFYILTLVGLFVLRRKRPSAPRPYRAWGYPVTPAIYLVGAVFFLVYIFLGDPRDACTGLGLVALGFPAYWLLRRRGAAAA